MKIEGIITKVFPTRWGISQRTNEPWVMTDICISFSHKEPGYQEQDHEVIATISGEPDMELLNSAVTNRKMLAINLYFSVRVYQKRDGSGDGFMNSVRAYMPEGYVLKDKRQ